MRPPILSRKFKGMIRKRPLKTMTGPEFMDAIAEVGWNDGTSVRLSDQARRRVL
jgi:hypothetical protein